MQKPIEKPEVPFFVRFLEAQDALEVRTDVKAGVFGGGRPPVVTLKYPSDGDDNPPSI